MCGIGGFSLSKKSKINPRSLSNALLTELDIRGNQASGFAFHGKDYSGVYKKDVAGARLNLKGMPRQAKSVILHTRYATHGSISDMANNHPVQSPDRSINLVHNGVIYNHDLVRKSLDHKLPEVDSSVIPTILQQFNRDTDKFSMLDGDASVAWLDDSDRKTLRVARISHSPLVIAQLKDGSFVFASTEDILTKALKRLGLKMEYLQTVPERKLLEVRSGRIDAYIDLPDTDPAFVDTSWKSYYGSYRNMTSGNQQCATGDTTIKSLWGDIVVPSSWLEDDSEFDFPQVPNLGVNQYGEYFDSSGTFVADYNDLVEWGFIKEDGETIPWSESAFYSLYI
jgi:asparagine synthetase B (glutamine-hydrolysing)